GVSADGSVVVGYSSRAGVDTAFRWTSGGGMVGLGALSGGRSCAFGVSGNGAVVVGHSNTGSGDIHAFRWTSGGGMQDLGVLNGSPNSTAQAANVDGSVVVGTSSGTAFLWTSSLGMVNLNTYFPSRGINLAGWT